MKYEINISLIKEVAPLLNCAEVTIRRLVKARRIPFHKVGSRYLFSDDGIQEYLSSVKVEPVVMAGGEK